jgi:hypothetical protein
MHTLDTRMTADKGGGARSWNRKTKQWKLPNLALSRVVISFILYPQVVLISHTLYIYIHTSYIMASQHTGKFTWGVGPQKVSQNPT